MSLFDTMRTGASGLGVASMSLAVIGDNIANVNTIGFKGSRASFANLIPQYSGSLSGQVEVGNGAGVLDVATLFGQGDLTTTSSSLDMAISGGGFFALSEGDNLCYSRAGQFSLDVDGYLVTADSMRLQGHNVRDNTLQTQVTDLRLDTTPLAPNATENITLSLLLSTETDYSTTPISGGTYTLDGLTDTIEDVTGAADYTTSVTIYDALGQSHECTVVFERTATNDWAWNALIDGGDIGATDGMAFSIANGTCAFDGNGVLTAFTQVNTSATTPWNFTGATAGDIVFDFGFSGASPAEGDVRMQGTVNALNAIQQDGWTVGNLSGVTIDADGIIRGAYSNGEEAIMGQVVLASFESIAGLVREGGNLFRSTQKSGDPALGAPNTDGRGTIQGYSLEASNVDLEAELIAMIEAQRSFQANAKTIDTANQTLQELVQLV